MSYIVEEDWPNGDEAGRKKFKTLEELKEWWKNCNGWHAHYVHIYHRYKKNGIKHSDVVYEKSWADILVDEYKLEEIFGDERLERVQAVMKECHTSLIKQKQSETQRKEAEWITTYLSNAVVALVKKGEDDKARQLIRNLSKYLHVKP